MRKHVAKPIVHKQELSFNSWLILLSTLVWAFVVLIPYLNTGFFPSLNDLVQLIPSQYLPTPDVLGQDLLSIALYASMLTGCMGLGFHVFRRVNTLLPSSIVMLSATLGLGILSYLVLLLGALHLYRPITFWSLLVLLLLHFLFQWTSGMGPVAREGGREIVQEIKGHSVLILIPLALILSVALAMSFVPEIFYDAMVYHIGVPRWFLHEGGIGNYPTLHAQFPFAMQMLYTFGLALQGEAVPKLIHWGTGVLFSLLCLCWSKEIGVSRFGLLGALLFIGMPMSQINLWAAVVDVGTSLFVAAGVFTWLMALRKEENRLGLIILSGVFCGLAVSSKYTAGVLPLVIFIQTLVWGWRSGNFKQSVRLAFVLGAVSFVVFLPWMVKNYIYTGNPVFPFAARWFHSPLLDPNKLHRFYYENKGETLHSFGDVLRLPWTLTFGINSSLSFPGPLPLALLPAAFYAAWRGRKSNSFFLLFGTGLLCVIGVCFVNRYLRYVMPFLGVLVFSFVAFFAPLEGKETPKWARSLVLISVFIGSIANLLSGLGIILNSYRPTEVLWGQESRRAYLSYTHPSMNPFPATSAFDALRKASNFKKVLILGDEKVSTCEVPFLASGVFDMAVPLVWMKESSDGPEGLYQRMKKEGFTHILVNYFEGRRVAGYGIFDWPTENFAVFCEFWDKHVRLWQSVPINEKLYGQQVPVLIYSVEDGASAKQQPIPENPILTIEEERRFPKNHPDALEEKKRFYEAMLAIRPDIPSVRRELSQMIGAGLLENGSGADSRIGTGNR